jgi:hypothetical protein
MPEKLMDIRKVALINNCPVCYSTDGLHLKFNQKIIETKFYKSITSEINHELACEKCDSIIYPEQWTDDIDRVVAYQKKAFTPKNSSTYLKKLTWIVIIIIAVVIVAIAFTMLYYKL